MSEQEHYSVRAFDGKYETARYRTREQAEEDAVLHRGERIGEDGVRETTVGALVVPVPAEDLPDCAACGQSLATSKDPGRYPYCKNCHYTGLASEHERAEQIARLAAAVEGASVSVEHTGGGCFWMSFRFEGDPKYYVLTDGEASLPSDAEGDLLASGGWGYVGRHDDTEDESNADYEGTVLVWVEDAFEEGAALLSDEQAVAAILEDIGKRAAVA